MSLVKVKIEALDSEDDKYQIIAEYEARPWMWQFKHDGYKDNQRKIETWTEIAGLMSNENRTVTGNFS